MIKGYDDVNNSDKASWSAEVSTSISRRGVGSHYHHLLFIALFGLWNLVFMTWMGDSSNILLHVVR